MKEHVYLPEDEMIRRAIDALMEKLGPIETARFLNLPRRRKLDSVKRHREWQKRLNKDSFFDEVFGVKAPPRS